MKHVERITPIAAAASAPATLLCCLPLGFAAAAAATASVAIPVAKLRPWLLGASVLLVAIGFVQVYRRKACDRRSRVTVAILWVCAAIVVLVTLFPQLFATAIADFVPSR